MHVYTRCMHAYTCLHAICRKSGKLVGKHVQKQLLQQNVCIESEQYTASTCIYVGYIYILVFKTKILNLKRE